VAALTARSKPRQGAMLEIFFMPKGPCRYCGYIEDNLAWIMDDEDQTFEHASGCSLEVAPSHEVLSPMPPDDGGLRQAPL
jgi:hypothetical protein